MNIEPLDMPPLVLAYVGDAVFELYVRTRVAESGGIVRELHRKTVSLVRASSQARMAHAIEPVLNEAEHNIWRRGRNAKPGTVPRSAEVIDYHHSTAFEAVLGYLYLTGQTARLDELLEMALRIGREEAAGDGKLQAPEPHS